MRFEKGRSGNPGGRPRGHGKIRDLARQYTRRRCAPWSRSPSTARTRAPASPPPTPCSIAAGGKPAAPVGEADEPVTITLDLGRPRYQPALAEPLPARLPAGDGDDE
jgi:hypothetical protein